MSALLLAVSSLFTARANVRAFDGGKTKVTSASEITMSSCQFTDLLTINLLVVW